MLRAFTKHLYLPSSLGYSCHHCWGSQVLHPDHPSLSTCPPPGLHSSCWASTLSGGRCTLPAMKSCCLLYFHQKFKAQYLKTELVTLQYCIWHIWCKQLKRRKVVFWAMIWEFSVHGLLAPILWAWGQAEHHGGRSVWRKTLLTSWWPGSKEREEEAGNKTPFKSMSPVTHFSNQVPIPVFYHFPIVHSLWVHQGMIHWLGQSLHDPMTSQWLDPPAGDQAFNPEPFGGTLQIQAIAKTRSAYLIAMM
jgi:hypothetical protein